MMFLPSYIMDTTLEKLHLSFKMFSYLMFVVGFNSKSYAVAILVFVYFPFFFPSCPSLDGLLKVFLLAFYHSLPRRSVTKITPILLDTLNEICVKTVF